MQAPKPIIKHYQKYIIILFHTILWIIPTQTIYAEVIPHEFFVFESIAYPNPTPTPPTTLPLDNHTEMAPDLTLTEIFHPPIGAYKRVHVLDDMRWKNGDIIFQTSENERTRLPPTTYNKNKKQYYAKYTLDLQASKPEPIPSASYNMEWISYDVIPSAELTFFKDSSDNYYVQANKTQKYEINLRIQIPPLGDPMRSPLNLIPTGEPLLGAPRSALGNILHNSPVREFLSKKEPIPWLLRFFRSFEPGALSETTHTQLETFQRILNEKKGICRHRTFAFAAIARYLGFRVRIITNEVHAFIELEHNDTWITLELGGAASSLTIQNAYNNHIHKTKNENFATYNQQPITFEIETSTLDKKAKNTAFPRIPATNYEQERENPEKLYLTHLDANPKDLKRGENTHIRGKLINQQGQGVPNHKLQGVLDTKTKKIPIGNVITDENGYFEKDVQIPIEITLGKSKFIWTSETHSITEKTELK